MQENMARWRKVDNMEKERLGRAWSMMERERRAISDTMDALIMEAGKSSSAMWKLNRRVQEIMADLRETLCDNCREEGRAHERKQCGSRSVRAPSTKREQRGPQPAKAHSAGGEKEKLPVEVLSRDGRRIRKPERQGDSHGLEAFDNSRMTKLITTGGPTAVCYQLYTQCGVAVWK